MESLNSTYPLGSRENPVKCDGVLGEIEYLVKLATPDGKLTKYQRKGSNSSNNRILDKYIIMDADDNFLSYLYMDMYHPNYVENEVISGLVDINDLNESKSHQDIMYFFSRVSLLNFEEDYDIPDKYVYLWTKAGFLLTKGVFTYALDDAFSLPLETMNIKALKNNSFKIVHNIAGVHAKYPLIIENENEVIDLFLVFHFKIISKKILKDKDAVFKIQLEHIVTSEKLDFFYKYI
jgi:hypothetical protein